MSASSSAAFNPIVDIDAVDLGRHALVEASAGTGKTYTIENLVVRLLKENPALNIENILLVTFTEKATGELKQRIRRKIEATLEAGRELTAAMQKKLKATLDGFDDAAIFTIHGFCHTLLKELPFETGGLFQQELIDDRPLLEKLLKSQMRAEWPQRYGPHLSTLLALADFSANPDGFIETTVNLAQRLGNDSTREVLIPDPAGLDAEDLIRAVHETLLALKSLVGPPPELSAAYRRLNIHAGTKAAVIRDIVDPLEAMLPQVDDENSQISLFMPLVNYLGGRQSDGELNLERLIPRKWLKAGENLDECPGLSTIKQRLDELVRHFAGLSRVLMLDAVRRMQATARALKARNGWISYQDMLTRVADFLTRPENEAGIREIRRRYQVAFVDEFQDTDDVQWRIFSTLFLDAADDRTDNRLFLIGDPKQAIYGFRGADVFTYLTARQEMKRLAGKGRANLYALAKNWRSTPDLVDAFNRLFAQKAWFGAGEKQGPFEIGYQAVVAPAPHERRALIAGDRSRRAPLTVLDLTGAKNHAAAKERLAGFICREIRYLVEQGGMTIDDGNGGDRPLNFGDIALLVRSQSEFALLEPMLSEALIPYAYYRKPGLFQCPQAHWLSIVLRAVAAPHQTGAVKLALLTPFFDIAPGSLESRPELPPAHISQLLLMRWHAHAQKRHWGPLFQSLMEDSGLISRHCLDPGWPRTATNFQQLFDYLENAAFTRNLDIGGMVALLDGLRQNTVSAGSDADIHQIDDEGNKVRILTMHVSKGLEFPVVFIAGGLTVRHDEGIRVYHEADPAHPEQGCRKVIDLIGRGDRSQAEKEDEDENKRLYYVALTRARLKLYLPYYPDGRNHRWLGPVCRFVSRSIDQAFARDAGAAPAAGWQVVELTGAQASAMPPGRNATEDQFQVRPADPLLPPQVDFRQRKIFLESFSSIGHRISRIQAEAGPPAAFHLADAAGREDDEPAAGLPAASADPDAPDALPGGTQMGSMLHHIFEHIDFQAVLNGAADILSDDGVRNVIESALALYRIEPRWLEPVAGMVAGTLRAPIDVDGTTIVLGRLLPAQRRHEMEFYFPLAPSAPIHSPVPGCTVSGEPGTEMMIRGFIDLVFSWESRYYILDWKSNRLEDGYRQAAMAREMAAAGYILQYQLYSVAVLRWLTRRLGKRFDPRRHFGGVFYIFLRGVADGGRDGIFYVPPRQLLPLAGLEETIKERIAGLQW